MGTSADQVSYKRAGSAAVVTIDRPERRNAVDGPTAEALLAAFLRFEGDSAAQVLVLTAAGGQAFCAGADLQALESLGPRVTSADGPLGFTRRTPSKPVIAAVEGWCVAGGLELALWCDLRVAGKSARFGCLERRWGVPLIDGGTYRLPRVIGLGRALDLILTGREVDSAEALAIGLVTRVVDDGTAVDDAVALAGTIAAFPWDCVVADRDSVYRGLGLGEAEALVAEDQRGKEIIFAPGFADGVERFTKPREA